MKRLISHTEITAAMDCQARWSFQYGGQLTGGHVLKRKRDDDRLQEGRAWGRAVAALHRIPDATDRLFGPLARIVRALDALDDALDEDAAKLREHGLYVEHEHHDMRARLADLLTHYSASTSPLSVHSPEIEMRVPMPSRTGRGVSNRYVFHGYLDALTSEHPDYMGRLFIVEYKLRDRLTDPAQIRRSQQIRRYAWAAEQVLDRPVHGVIVDERLNEVPKPARWVQGKKKTDPARVPSHAKDQLTTRALYEEACQMAGVPVDHDTAAVLGARRWQQRVPVVFRRGEIREAGLELVSAAQLIAQLDGGQLHPVRNTLPQRCGGCPFREVCPDPSDVDLIALDFDLRPPKRLRPALEVVTRG